MKDKRDENYYRSYLEHKTVSRRGLFRGLLSGANKSLKESSQNTIKPIVARSPYAIEEGLFRELCQDCEQCATACPQHVIEMVDARPQLNLDYNHCTFCEECQLVCDSGALGKELGVINLQPEFISSCNNKLSGGCEVCADACPQKAIIIEPRKLPQVDASLCNGCGLCRSACFIGAVQMTFVVPS
ncbi:ferredoxin-type protein NapF [Aliivibrio fischeri]|uniref:ferredoxin-type protein NapF n=1 Tax=Aliivibrio fischeri TaxID=668 RepID=UPI0006D1773B|nr:ferredoxin-type protein NapF [Aliivibrio fischeri]USR97626.1 ferredoxin-type protein NapF [Aliivibrio fischeri ATCC 7744 = JCM 18803 = DSM 507]GGK36044.1 ferredoxin-type protein NapF [Aliivibrio fischeri]